MKNKLLNSMKQADNVTTTLNGAVTFKSTLNSVLDFFALGAALRQRSAVDKISLFTKAFAEDSLLAMKALFNVRNIRGGAGERQAFRDILGHLARQHSNVVVKNFDNIVKFGRWDDLFVLFGTACESDMLKYISKQLAKDKKTKSTESISLLAKWMPSINTSSAKTVTLAKRLAKYLELQPREYRKLLSKLRTRINVVEKQMSAQDWPSINYEQVPSRASLLYKDAFKKHDLDRYNAYLAAVNKGTAKINAGTLYPYDIYDKVRGFGSDNATVDALWKALPDYMGDNKTNMLVVADVSGSMMGRPMSISVSLALYIAERNKGAFHNNFITFSEKPKLQTIVGSTVSTKMNNLERAEWGMSTNLQAVFNLILSHATKSAVPATDMPSQIIIVSDMEFNHACQNTNLESMREKYKSAGYAMPNIVFWNVNSHQNNVPAKADDKGVLLVSGASPSVLKTLLSGRLVTPVDQMLETLNQAMYDSVVV